MVQTKDSTLIFQMQILIFDIANRTNGYLTFRYASGSCNPTTFKVFPGSCELTQGLGGREKKAFKKILEHCF